MIILKKSLKDLLWINLLQMPSFMLLNQEILDELMNSWNIFINIQKNDLLKYSN